MGKFKIVIASELARGIKGKEAILRERVAELIRSILHSHAKQIQTSTQNAVWGLKEDILMGLRQRVDPSKPKLRFGPFPFNADNVFEVHIEGLVVSPW